MYRFIMIKLIYPNLFHIIIKMDKKKWINYVNGLLNFNEYTECKHRTQEHKDHLSRPFIKLSSRQMFGTNVLRVFDIIMVGNKNIKCILTCYNPV